MYPKKKKNLVGTCPKRGLPFVALPSRIASLAPVPAVATSGGTQVVRTEEIVYSMDYVRDAGRADGGDSVQQGLCKDLEQGLCKGRRW